MLMFNKMYLLFNGTLRIINNLFRNLKMSFSCKINRHQQQLLAVEV
jgi:hypothetical protein